MKSKVSGRKKAPKDVNGLNQFVFDEFWSRVLIGEPNECWEWIGSYSGTGYGEFNLKGRKYGAHVISYHVNYGPYFPWLTICHDCDNTKCVNPKHLTLGTQSVNIKDYVDKFKGPGSITGDVKGSHNGRAKLNEEKVREIRRLRFEEEWSLLELSKLYGVNPSNIHNAAIGRTWKHVK